MKRISILTIVFSWLVLLNACRDEDWSPAPDMNDHIGAVTLIQVNPEKNFYNALNSLAEEEVEFILDVDGFDVTEVASVDIILIFTEKDGIYNEAEDEYEDREYPPVKVGEITSFPSTFSISAVEAAEALGWDIADFEVGDSFNLMFPIHSADGRTFTVALNSDLCQQPAQPSFGGCNVAWPIACPSSLGGEYSVISSGTSTDTCPSPATLTNFAYSRTITFTALGGGNYRLNESLGGQYIEWYGACYGYDFETANTIVDVCNTISGTFATAFGESFSISGSVDPDTGVITINWKNNFGDTGTNVYTPVE